jgi:hypothetical protein
MFQVPPSVLWRRLSAQALLIDYTFRQPEVHGMRELSSSRAYTIRKQSTQQNRVTPEFWPKKVLCLQIHSLYFNGHVL